MNSSVSNPPNVAQRDLYSTTNHEMGRYLAATHNSPLNSTLLNQMGGQLRPGAYLASPYAIANQPGRSPSAIYRHPEANSPVASYQPLPATAQQPSDFSGARPTTKWRPALIGEHYLPSPAKVEDDQNESEAGDEASGEADTGEQDGSEQSDEQQPDDAGAEQAGEQDEPDGELSPLNGQQMESRLDRRSFSEDSSSANERDRHGKPLATHRRHLVNGRPIKRKQSTAATTADFERVVDEIDEANKQQEQHQQPTAAPDYDESPEADKGQSRVRPAVEAGEDVKPEGDTGEEPPRPSRDEHEHRLSESLKAQQWDDDSVSPPNQSTRAPKITRLLKRSDAEPEDADHAEESSAETSTISPADGQIEFSDLDLFANSDKFPFMSDRRKRQAPDYNGVYPLTSSVENSTTSSEPANQQSMELAVPAYPPTLQPTIAIAPPGAWQVANATQLAADPVQPTDQAFNQPTVEPSNWTSLYPIADPTRQLEEQLYGPQVAVYQSVGQPSDSKKIIKVSKKSKKEHGSMHKHKMAKAQAINRKTKSKKG